MLSNKTTIRFLSLVQLFYNIYATLTEAEKIEFCNNLQCDESIQQTVCGIRYEDQKPTFRWFDNECKLLKYGCQVEGEKAYGIITRKYCEEAENQEENMSENSHSSDSDQFCSNSEEPVCGIRMEGEGFVVRIFQNACQLTKYNKNKGFTYHITDYFICTNVSIYDDNGEAGVAELLEIERNLADGVKPAATGDNKTTDLSKDAETIIVDDADSSTIITETNTDVNDESAHSELFLNSNEPSDGIVDEIEHTNLITSTPQTIAKTISWKKEKNIIVVKTPLLAMENLNQSINNFFASTHIRDLPIQELKPGNVASRRSFVKIFRPVVVFEPSIVKPQNVSEDYYHQPTLNSCYHKCPVKCPNTYAPVCGMAGMASVDPALVFHNHCYMDAAQCKLVWDDISPTANLARYVESSFIFCMGQEYYNLYRFMPLVRTLQHMGRLKLKSTFKQKIRNMRFPNEMLKGPINPKFIG